MTDGQWVGAQPTTIVPANRLGQLLAEARLRRGRDLAELSERSLGDFTVGELSDLEAGHRLLDDQTIARVTNLYELDCGPIIPQRAELTIDLDENLVSAAGKVLRLDSAERNHILDRYLSLVYVLRNRPPGAAVPLREEDVAILAASLAERSELIEEQLLLAMEAGGERVNGLVRWFRSRLWVPGAGALVGAVSVGSLVMIASSSSDTTSMLEGPAEPDENEEPGVPSLPLTDATGTAIAAPAVAAPTITAPATTTPASTAPATTRQVGSRAGSPSTSDPMLAPADLGDAAEALLPFDWQAVLPGWEIIYTSSDPDYRGLTYPYERRIEMYVRASDTPASLAGVLAHEIGHAIDVTHFSDSQRARWMSERGIGDADWWPSAYASDFETGAGDFAEAFAYWAVGDPNSSRIAGVPDGPQLDLLGELLHPHL